MSDTMRDDPLVGLVDIARKVGIAGHSMGGLSTSIAASYENAAKFNIGGAVLHHPACDSYDCAPSNITTVPLLGMTGTDKDDRCCGATTTHKVSTSSNLVTLNCLKSVKT